jgi:uncharacterized protein
LTPNTSIPHILHYQLTADASCAVTEVDVRAEGAGWSRRVQMARKGRDWRVTTQEIGDLDLVLARHGHPGALLPGIDDAERACTASSMSRSVRSCCR